LFRQIIKSALIFWGLSLGAVAQGLPERYHTYQEVLDTLALIRDSFPSVLYLDTMGYSTRDSVPMLRLKISDNASVDEDEPAVFFCSGVHADEVLGVEVTLFFVHDILRRYALGETQATRFINELEIFVVPFINPEGHIVVENGLTSWRKNKCDNNSNGVFDGYDGVDNNRNYDFGWQLDTSLSATSPDSPMYKGTAPFTQSENRAMADFAWKYRPIVALDYHSPTYGRAEVAYYPWYYDTTLGGHGYAPDAAFMGSLCRSYASRILCDIGASPYAAAIGYVRMGDFRTYFYANFGTVAFTVEISDTTIQTPATLIDLIVRRHLNGTYYLLSRSLGAGITGIIRDSITFEPLEAEVQVLERINPDINPRLSRPDFGRYHRLLSSGTYTLRFIKEGYYIKQVNNVAVGGTSPTVVDVYLSPVYPRPPAPVLVYPDNYDTLPPGSIAFVWLESNFASRYLFELAADSSFNSLLIYDSTLSSTGYFLDIPFPDGDYYWRVKGGNTNGWGPYSARVKFIILTGLAYADEGTIPKSFALHQNYPNPFNTSTIIGFDLPKSSPVTLEVFDLTGALVSQKHLGLFSPGRHSVRWRVGDSPNTEPASGIYIIRLKTSEWSDSRKILMLK